MVLCAKIELVGLKSKEAHMTCLKTIRSLLECSLVVSQWIFEILLYLCPFSLPRLVHFFVHGY